MKAEFIPLERDNILSSEEGISMSNNFYEEIKSRRTIRDFSDLEVPFEIIENCIKAAGTAPSGANLQPWHFAVVKNQEVKESIRVAAEEEEKAFYEHKAPKAWLEALAPLGTDANKPFLNIAPYLIAVFARSYDILEDATKRKNYYVQESVGLASGFLIAALHKAGLGTLTHTPSPMNFLNKILDRPKNERAILLIVVGYPAKDAMIPKQACIKKPLEEIMSIH